MEQRLPLLMVAGLPGTLREQAAGILGGHLSGYQKLEFGKANTRRNQPEHKPVSREEAYGRFHLELEKRLSSTQGTAPLILTAPYETALQRVGLYNIASGAGREVLALEFLALPETVRQRLQRRPKALVEYDALQAGHQSLRQEFPIPYKEPEPMFHHVSAVSFVTDPVGTVGPRDSPFTTMISRLTDTVQPVYGRVREILCSRMRVQ
ncbi:hypothetical protein HYS47_04100 [Candidatus Woesearchaeota archaeon]|nr:hypothetical protein [Candidatus Woesearchaeota archaeon]